jgi:hypothetical protein
MIAPTERSNKGHAVEILEHWLEHGDHSTAARMQKANNVGRYGKRDRQEKEQPWVVTVILSAIKTEDGKIPWGRKLGRRCWASNRETRRCRCTYRGA